MNTRPFITAAFAIILCFTSAPIGAQAVGVSFLIDEMEASAESLINLGFDRLDRSIINAGIEMQVVARSFRENYEGALDKTIDELDGVQARVVDDLQTLLRKLEDAENDQIAGIVDDQMAAVNSIYSLFSDTALVNNFEQVGSVTFTKTAGISQEKIIVVAHGVSLQSANPLKVMFAGKAVDEDAILQDNSKITFNLTLPMGTSPLADIERGLLRLPLRFTLEECSFFGFFCGDGAKFGYDVVAFPDPYGKARITYGGTISELDSEPRQFGPFDSPRVKSRLKFSGIKAGKRTDIWTATATPGWSIDLASAEVIFKPLNSGCSNSRTKYSWQRQDRAVLQVRAETGSDRKAGATCRSRTIIKFSEVKPKDTPILVQSEKVDLPVQGRAIPPEALEEESIAMPRVVSVEIESDLFGPDGANTRVFNVGEDGKFVGSGNENVAISIDVDQSSRLVTLRLDD